VAFWGQSKWGTATWKDLSGYTLTPWWNNSYQFRRKIRITPDPFRPVEVGYPITVEIDYPTYLTLKKMRSDFADIEIIKINRTYDFADEVLERVPFKVVQDPVTLKLLITFNAVERITYENVDYSIYYHNSALSNIGAPLAYTDSDYVISVTPESHTSALTFTRPTEDWKFGFSDVINARVALSFYGRNARLQVEKGPDRGTLELRVDDGIPVMINTYNQTYVDDVVYTTSGLTVGDHMIRVRVTGDKAASSQAHGIQFRSFDYSFHVDTQLLFEEIQPEKNAIDSVIGA
jgi:hypothetical protein